MFNPFPELLFLGTFLAPFILRVTVGALFITFGYDLLFRRQHTAVELLQERFGGFSAYIPRLAGAGTILIGLAFVAGFYTQIAALLGILFALKMLVLRKTKYRTLILHSPALYILILAVSLSLLFSGAGAFAIDLPL